MRKLFSLYKKRVGRKTKTEKLEDAVSIDSLNDDKADGPEGGSSVDKNVELNKPTSNRTRVEVAESPDSLEIQSISQGPADDESIEILKVRDEDRLSLPQDGKPLSAEHRTVGHLEEAAGEADAGDDTDDWRHSRAEATVDEESEDRARRNVPQRKRSFSNAAEVIDYIPERVHSLPPRLHENLLGVIAVEVTENNPANLKFRRYIDWRGEKIVCSELYDGIPDTTVTVSEYVLMEISRGNLNPQIALVSNRVRVSGKIGFGIYFFNLISAR